jgi:hypothetical protein
MRSILCAGVHNSHNLLLKYSGVLRSSQVNSSLTIEEPSTLVASKTTGETCLAPGSLINLCNSGNNQGSTALGAGSSPAVVLTGLRLVTLTDNLYL